MRVGQARSAIKSAARTATRYGVIALLPLAVAAAVAGLPPAAAQQAANSPKPAQAAPAIEPKALAILKAAGDTLASARTLSFTAVNTYEKAAGNGQPLYYTTRNEVVVQKPDKLRVITPGDGVPDEFYYDGKTMTAYVPSADLAAVAEVPPTIEGMLNAAWQKAAIYFPFVDIVSADPFAALSKVLKSAFYVGQSHVIGGTTTDMIAVASDDIQAEIWIGTDDHLPRRVLVTYPHEPARAHYGTDFSDWHLGQFVPPSTFTSDRAALARRMPFAPPGAGVLPGPGAGTQQ